MGDRAHLYRHRQISWWCVPATSRQHPPAERGHLNESIASRKERCVMVRVVNQKLMETHAPELTPAQKAAARRNVEKIRRNNPLRRVRTDCCGWVRDPLAITGERVWCEHHADWTLVVEHAE